MSFRRRGPCGGGEGPGGLPSVAPSVGRCFSPGCTAGSFQTELDADPFDQTWSAISRSGWVTAAQKGQWGTDTPPPHRAVLGKERALPSGCTLYARHRRSRTVPGHSSLTFCDLWAPSREGAQSEEGPRNQTAWAPRSASATRRSMTLRKARPRSEPQSSDL